MKYLRRELYILATFLIFVVSLLLYLVFWHSDTRKLTVVAFGDSITEGYGLPYEYSYTAQLEKLLHKSGYPKAQVFNQGVSGFTSVDGVANLPRVLSLQPDVVIVEFGANDARKLIPPNVLKENLLYIISELQSRGIVVVFAGVKMPFDFAGEYGMKMENVFHEVAKEKNVLFIPNILEGIAFNPDRVQKDALHPNEKGQSMIAKSLVYPKVVEAFALVGKKRE